MTALQCVIIVYFEFLYTSVYFAHRTPNLSVTVLQIVFITL